MSTAAPSRASVTIRRAKPEDAPACGQICYEAFQKISTDHNFPPDVPAPEMAVGLLTRMFSDPGSYCVVAEADGRIVGSNCLYERDSIAGLGPITIDPKTQNRGVGRKLMDAALDRARERNCAGVRLVQAAFHNRSLSLYTSLGFDVREPLATIQGPAIKKTYDGFTVRPAKASDLEACNQVALRVHGHHRGGELAEAIQQRTATVVERYGRITGYASSLAFYGHAVAETNPDLQAIIAAADSFAGPGILVPSRNSEIFRWCLSHGLRVVQPMTLMSMGLYNEPKGAFLPSILY
ncbi:MAG: GNAT family N-acetyltransferase [Bryobacteraceae bacterium]|jgi:predicted N-acetyltransferase YhbS